MAACQTRDADQSVTWASRGRGLLDEVELTPIGAEAAANLVVNCRDHALPEDFGRERTGTLGRRP